MTEVSPETRSGTPLQQRPSDLRLIHFSFHSMISQNDYLERMGVLDSGDSDLVAHHKAEYRKAYKRAKNRQYRASRKRTEMYLTAKEHERFKSEAKAHGMRLGEFIRHAGLAYLDQSFLLPPGELVHDLKVQIKRIGNNINQVAHLANAKGAVGQAEILACHNWIGQMVRTVQAAMTQPPTLQKVFEQGVKADPTFLEKAQKLLDQFSQRGK